MSQLSVADMNCIVFPTAGIGDVSTPQFPNTQESYYSEYGELNGVATVTTFVTATVKVVGSIVSAVRAKKMRDAMYRDGIAVNRSKSFVIDVIGSYNQKAFEIADTGYTSLGGVISSMSSKQLAGIVNDGQSELKLLFPMGFDYALKDLNAKNMELKRIGDKLGNKYGSGKEKSDALQDITSIHIQPRLNGIFDNIIKAYKKTGIAKVEEKKEEFYSNLETKSDPLIAEWNKVMKERDDKAISLEKRLSFYGLVLVYDKELRCAICPTKDATEIQMRLNQSCTVKPIETRTMPEIDKERRFRQTSPRWLYLT